MHTNPDQSALLNATERRTDLCQNQIRLLDDYIAQYFLRDAESE